MTGSSGSGSCRPEPAPFGLFKEAAVKKILVLCLFFMCGFAFAEEELGYVYFKAEVIDTPWTGFVPPRAVNLSNMVCVDIIFKSNLPKEYTDYFIDHFEASEINEGLRINGSAFGYKGKVFSLFTRTEDGFVSRRPFVKKWEVLPGLDSSMDSPNMGSYQHYREEVMQGWFVSGVQFIVNTTGEDLSAKAVGNTAVPGLFEDVERGFRFRQTNVFERKWIVYKK
jgi:hypothetical protein